MEKVRIGMISCGGNARHHMYLLSRIAEAQVVALCDPDVRQIELAKAAYPHLADVPTFSDYKTMLSAVEMDAVEISTPHTQHVDQILDAFAAGLHVQCEKPLVTSTKDAVRVIQARDKCGKVGLLAYQRHTTAEHAWIREVCKSGKLGKPTMFNASLGQEWKQLTIGSWRQDPALSGGGQLNDSGSHVIDLMLWVMGVRASVVSAFIDNRGTPVDVNSAVCVKFDSGAMGNITIVGDAPCWQEDISFWFEKGALLLRNGKLTMQDEAGTHFAIDNIRGGSSPDANFINAILGRQEVVSPFECGLRVIELTEAAWKSASLGGQPVTIEETKL